MNPMARWPLSALVVVAGSLVLGGLTSWAQGFLPDALSSFANSPSGWTVLTASMIVAVRPTVAAGAVLGVVSFVSLVLGYTVASELRGLAYDPLFWSLVGVVAGPFVGAAAAAVVGGHAVRAALGAGALAGALVADAIYGLTVVGDTTSPVYWLLCLALGVVLLGVVVVRLRSRVALTTLAGTAVAATGVLGAGYAVLNGLA
ncbi:DUF6518 family protein [Nocardioides sp. zg-1228]|uniref:DUF6518 family protein n=1 Tax=Nocardioides sp. zg-1228 TaxID=2763008 RepID=UPI00164321D8|nr:DUF6518 family protein [Nocardioides sp. zg-1228]MBC2933676.1 hypothetical protein [Nocardioides sp. zg-1228]QSF56207.1 hypothetical protein JX575_11020 [Nocardioides sp. zg-1228]